MSVSDFGYDPELPAGFQDADFEMRDFEAAAEEKRRAANRAKLKAMSFDEWKACVNSWCERLAGCSADDLPDWDFATAYEERLHPKTAARRVISAAREG
jgi:hypothetical protein